jgi:hypothetical protein
MNGFAPAAADPELDLMARLQTSEAGEDPAAASVVRSPTVFGTSVAAPPQSPRRAATLQALLTLQRTGRPAVFRRLLASSLLTPASEFWIVFGTAFAVVAGWQPWTNVVLAIVAVSFCRALVSTAALLVRGSAPRAPEGSVLDGLLLMTPAEFLVRAPDAAAAWADAIVSQLQARRRR